MKLFFSTFNHKILYLTIPIVCIPMVCRTSLSQNDCTDCKIITCEGEEKVCLGGVPGLLSMH
jgi:hypothetical protein